MFDVINGKRLQIIFSYGLQSYELQGFLVNQLTSR